MLLQRGGTRIETSLVIVIFKLRVLTYVVSYKLFWDCIQVGVLWFVSHEVWFDKGFVIWHISLRVRTTCVVVITEYWNSNHLYHRRISRQDKILAKMRRRPDFYMEQYALQARFIKQNAPQARFFDWILMGSLSYRYDMWLSYKSQLRIFFLQLLN